MSSKNRSGARLAAVQALYQMEVSGLGVEAVIREFSEHRFDRDIDGVKMPAADEDFFAQLIRGVVATQADIDVAITSHLASKWKLERVDATLRALLRAGAFELIETATATEIVIDEYLELAKSFFNQTETGFVNACLDAIARDRRSV
jgi:N utilization substance protein B